MKESPSAIEPNETRTHICSPVRELSMGELVLIGKGQIYILRPTRIQAEANLVRHRQYGDVIRGWLGSVHNEAGKGMRTLDDREIPSWVDEPPAEIRQGYREAHWWMVRQGRHGNKGHGSDGKGMGAESRGAVNSKGDTNVKCGVDDKGARECDMGREGWDASVEKREAVAQNDKVPHVAQLEVQRAESGNCQSGDRAQRIAMQAARDDGRGREDGAGLGRNRRVGKGGERRERKAMEAMEAGDRVRRCPTYRFGRG
ncbi:hypothetical protein C8R45DRAFT_940910 [Mycena sanguinolenta]|nr:hypothetical protein C8R45DRAFT_940910 [Mycena sanguinolenta]